MQISDTTSSYAGSQAQRLLAGLMAQKTEGAGQSSSATNAEGVHKPRGGPPPGPPPSGPPPGADSQASSQFSADTLAELLQAQQEPPSASDVAAKLIGDVDADGDGSLSLSEIQTALGSDETSSAEDSLSKALTKLDADGDGKLSTAELTTALEAFKSAHDPGKRASSSAALEVAA